MPTTYIDGHVVQQPTIRSERDLTPNQKAVLRHLRIFGPMTDEKLVETYQPRVGGCVPVPVQAPSGLRTRRHELVEAGFVGWTGAERITRFGKKAQEWRAL